MPVRDAARDVNALSRVNGDTVASEPYSNAAQAMVAASFAVGDNLVDEIVIAHRGPDTPRVTVKCHGRDAVTLEFTDKASAIAFYKLAWQQFDSIA